MILWIVALFLSLGLPVKADVNASPLASLPAAYKGRFRPADTYARLWLYDMSHRQSLSATEAEAFLTPSRSALDLMWQLHFLGKTAWEEAPLFWLSRADLKAYYHLDLKRARFSYRELKPVLVPIENASKVLKEWSLALLARLQEFEQNETFLMLPDRHDPGNWRSLKDLKLQHFDPQTNRLIPIHNFTSYPEATFQTMRNLYLEIEKGFVEKDFNRANKLTQELADTLHQAYADLAGRPYKEAFEKALHYPTFNQLEAEKLYYQLPLVDICLLLYGAAACVALLTLFRPSPILSSSALSFSLLVIIGVAFALHTLLLILRCYILMRPPVSNMFETVLYVPWVATLAALILRFICKTDWWLLAASLASLALLVLLKITQISSSLENVQAVLDSQYWLIIHVLMVVGSYGLFLLCGVLGHGYLCGYLYNRQETPGMAALATYILQSMYLGVALLVPGTILGGIWAAQSWGRFWDWDPKESWAFISSCIFLLWIHAHKFRYIQNFGLAVGAIVGLQAIGFTWYGVNYILGTGLHSYGFGSGGELYYYLFLASEGLFLSTALLLHRNWNLQKVT